MTLPNLELKYTKVSEKKNSNTNTNTINNNIILNSQNTETITKSPSVKSLDRVNTGTLVPNGRSPTPDNIKQFKETLMGILISYFKNNIVLLNNLVELSDKIITRIDNLQLLISLLLNVPVSEVIINAEEITVKNCCGEICKRLPRYRKLDDIIINKKQSFKVSYNQYYIQLQTEFNISLDYVLL
jgi:hypothetical protein